MFVSKCIISSFQMCDSQLEKVLTKCYASLGQLIASPHGFSAAKSTYERHHYQRSVSQD